MRSWLCIFLPHKLVHIVDVFNQPTSYDYMYGLWQCSRCKTLSFGKTDSRTAEEWKLMMKGDKNG